MEYEFRFQILEPSNKIHSFQGSRSNVAVKAACTGHLATVDRVAMTPCTRRRKPT